MPTYRVILDHVAGGRRADYNCVVVAPTSAEALTAVQRRLAESYGEKLQGKAPFGEAGYFDGMISVRPNSVEELTDAEQATLENAIKLEDLGAGD